MEIKMEIQKAAMIGAGSMGGGMTLLFAEHGLSISILDPSEETVDKLISSGECQGIPAGRLSKHTTYKSLCASLDKEKVFFFSLPHGTVGDDVIRSLKPFLEKGDIIVDCSNEDWAHTERRQGELVGMGVYYIGMGVSGGYQAARRGPSMSPGGQDAALDLVLPFLKKVAAKDADGRSCVAKIGQGGAGHYVKMVHNGIEHAMMSSISEAWAIMEKHLGMSYREIGDEFDRWNASGELKNTFLVKIGADICEKKNKKGNYVLADVQDKVVQDIDGTEGTGIWSNTQAIDLHIPAPTLAVAHSLRLASADRAQRVHAESVFGKDTFGSATKIKFSDYLEKAAFLDDLRVAVYINCLTSYIQGMNIISAADISHKWNISYSSIVQIWRAGCIIQADYIASLLESIYAEPRKDHNLLYEDKIAAELKKGFEALKRIVLRTTDANAVLPSLSASLEYLKYAANTDLPTAFYEAEMDYFGKHMYDSKSLDHGPGKPETGKHHFEWKPA
ncbi:6-phosphogluconate decarboxylating [Phlyctema vagabunda]|uniref:6-phosphogluconate dehydrogenase, decarboxylating n=1 Tax=Phlyctema vagabunda TaxID=108571 RepID=A0ABR4P351_9HELO